MNVICLKGFPVGSIVKNPPTNAGEVGPIPGSGRSPGKGNGNPLQYSCRENPMDGGARWVTVHEIIKELDMPLGTKTSLHLKGKEIHLPGAERFP